jgi:hypothetical protein
MMSKSSSQKYAFKKQSFQCKDSDNGMAGFSASGSQATTRDGEFGTPEIFCCTPKSDAS